MSQSDVTGIICTSMEQDSPCDAAETLGSTKNLHFAFLYESFFDASPRLEQRDRKVPQQPHFHRGSGKGVIIPTTNHPDHIS
jgi:hypothetical protein